MDERIIRHRCVCKRVQYNRAHKLMVCFLSAVRPHLQPRRDLVEGDAEGREGVLAGVRRVGRLLPQQLRRRHHLALLLGGVGRRQVAKNKVQVRVPLACQAGHSLSPLPATAAAGPPALLAPLALCAAQDEAADLRGGGSGEGKEGERKGEGERGKYGTRKRSS